MQHNFIIQSKKQEVPGVTTLSLTLENGSLPEWTAGQYINIHFPDTGTPEGKAYSISSAPHEEVFTLTVRDIGEFSRRLCTAEVGDTILGSLPYGFFAPEYEGTPLVLIASGISITPFRAILQDILHKNPERTVTLFHTIRNSADAIFLEELQKLTLGNFSAYHFVTREDNPTIPHRATRRIHVNDILETVSAPPETEFLLCGNISFTRDIWKALTEAGIHEHNIYTEAFFGH